MSSVDFHPCGDVELSAELKRLVESNVRRAKDGALELLRVQERRVLPAISNAHFSRLNEVQVANALASRDTADVYAVAIEALAQEPVAFVMRPSVEAMHAFQQTCGHFNYVLLDRSASSMVVCTTDEYMLYVGSLQFVEACAGSVFADAAKAFEQYASDSSWSTSPTGRRLQAVYATCMREFGGADSGSFVRI